jgi:hypothetical protein
VRAPPRSNETSAWRSAATLMHSVVFRVFLAHSARSSLVFAHFMLFDSGSGDLLISATRSATRCILCHGEARDRVANTLVAGGNQPEPPQHGR